MRNNENRIKMPVNYVNRDQVSIREEMENLAKNYYPDTYKNFNVTGFGSLMLDLASYLGDNLSFNVDYQANESINPQEFENILQIGKLKGYKYKGKPSSFGMNSFFCKIPAKTIGEGPDFEYYPILKVGTLCLSDSGGVFQLLEDLHFSDGNNRIVVAEVNSNTGMPSSYAVKSKGLIVSGELKTFQVDIGNFERFLKVKFEDENFSEIVSVIDSEGNSWFEVEHLSQNTIFKFIPNFSKVDGQPEQILKEFSTPRRFVVDFNGSEVQLQFGNGHDELVEELEVSNIALQQHGKTYISDFSFDPSKLVTNEKLGIVPTNTTLYINYRVNNDETSNAQMNSITRVVSPIVQFEGNRENLDQQLVLSVINSIECTNEEPIVGQTLEIDEEELRLKIDGSYSSQKRCVTYQDYKSVVYKMPSTLGGIKRCNIFTDPRSNKRNLNLYVVSEDSDGNLTTTNKTVKENLKTWINKFKMINDSVDILDARIINFGIEFVVLSDLNVNKYQILERTIFKISENFKRKMEIGEHLNIANIRKIVNDVESVTDLLSVKIVSKTGSNYSTTFYDFQMNTSPDGRFVSCPKNCIFELKYPEIDIRGVVK